MVRTPAPKDRLIVALDYPAGEEALALVERLGERILWYKVGLQLFTAEGPGIVRRLLASGKEVFLDLKLHDIPTTVAKAVASCAGIGAGLLTLHASAGADALREASGVRRALGAPMKLLGVTVLTSDRSDAEASMRRRVLDLAERAADAGLDGVVAPAASLPDLREAFAGRLDVLCAGIRPAGSPAHDQDWVATPEWALREGARWLVVGRPITAAPSPEAASDRILEAMAGGVGTGL